MKWQGFMWHNLIHINTLLQVKLKEWIIFFYIYFWYRNSKLFNLKEFGQVAVSGNYFPTVYNVINPFSDQNKMAMWIQFAFEEIFIHYRYGSVFTCLIYFSLKMIDWLIDYELWFNVFMAYFMHFQTRHRMTNWTTLLCTSPTLWTRSFLCLLTKATSHSFPLWIYTLYLSFNLVGAIDFELSYKNFGMNQSF